MDKILLSFIALFFLCGAGEYKILEVGQKAPFEGVLISVEALSQMQAKNDYMVNSVRSECAYQNSKNILELNKKYDLLYSECSIRIKSQQDLIDIKNKHLYDINEIAKKNTTGGISRVIWGISGVVIGALVGVGSVILYDSMSR